jgi:hypothetical protein
MEARRCQVSVFRFRDRTWRGVTGRMEWSIGVMELGELE